jgi:ribosomal protein S18 acetylase RimI-like enzyme
LDECRLDNPVWHALATQHAGFALKAEGAARYPAAVAPFAAVGDAPGRAGMQLASLIGDDESVFLVGCAPPAPAGWTLEPQKAVTQMVCPELPAEPPGALPVTMESESQRADMLELTALVFPGFFRPRTLEMGLYLGIYDGARLAAMAGERMRLDGWQELSAVCTHPRYTGRGLAQRLLWLLARRAFERGFAPFLHVFSDNTRAIGVYRLAGYSVRREIPLWTLRRHAD